MFLDRSSFQGRDIWNTFKPEYEGGGKSNVQIQPSKPENEGVIKKISNLQIVLKVKENDKYEKFHLFQLIRTSEHEQIWQILHFFIK